MKQATLGVTAAMLLAGAAPAGDATWLFDETTAGEDIFWMSPTAVDPASTSFLATYEIQLVEVVVSFIGIEFGPIDVTGEIPPRLLTGGGEAAGPAPVTLINQPIVFPEPPEPVAIAADLSIGLDANGFGDASATNVVLGTVEVDLGFPFGVQTVQLEEVRLVLSISVDGITAPSPDLDGDGSVGASDLAILLSQWGGAGAADLNLDGVVDAADLALLLAAWTS